MNKRTLILFTLVVFIVTAYSQEKNETADTKFEIKKHQLALDIEFFGVGITGAGKISSRMAVGVGIQLGSSFRFLVNDPQYLYCGGGCDEGDCCGYQNLKAAYFGLAEFAKVKIFWRYHITKMTYLNAGIFGSIGSMAGGDIPDTNYFTGLQVDLFTGWDKFKLGVKNQFGRSFLSYSSDKKSNFFLYTISPALQIYF